jgi:hypothetical protein
VYGRRRHHARRTLLAWAGWAQRHLAMQHEATRLAADGAGRLLRRAMQAWAAVGLVHVRVAAFATRGHVRARSEPSRPHPCAA